MTIDQLWASVLDFCLKQIPFAVPLILWIIDLRRQNRKLEAQLQSLNSKFIDDVVPLMTRLLDLIPGLRRGDKSS